MAQRAWKLPAMAAASFACFWATALVSNWFRDAPYYYQGRPNWSTNLVTSGTRFLTHAETVLFGASLCFLLPAIVMAAIHCARATKLDPFERWFARDDAERTAVVLATTLAVIVSAFVAFVIIRHADILDDERSHVFQARLFAHGKLGLPSPPAALRNPMIVLQPIWTSIYPPGHSVLLTLGSLAHDERFVPPVLAGILVTATWSFCRDAFGPRHGALAAVMMGASPFVWAVNGSVMSFATSAACAAVFLAGLARAEKTGASSWALLAGLVAGFAFITRPFEAVAFYTPFAIRFVWEAARRDRGAPARLLFYAAGFVAIAWVLLLHNHAVTGSYWRLAWQNQATPFKLGFGRSPAFGNFWHSPASAIGNLVGALGRLDGWAFGFPCSLLLVLAGLVRRDGNRYDRILRQTVLSYFGFYCLVPFSGTWDVGPTYYFGLMPVLVPCAVRGIQWARQSLGRIAAEGFATSVASWVVVFGVLASTFAIAPMRALALAELTSEIRAPWDTIESADIGEAIVVVPPIEQRMAPGWSHGYPYTLESARGRPVHLITPRTEEELSAALTYFGPLPVYLLSLDLPRFRDTGRRQFSLVPLGGGAPPPQQE